VLDILFHALVRWLAPVLVFTTEEVWGTRYPEGGSVHLLGWPEVNRGWEVESLGRKWSHIRELRELVTEAIEPMRRDKQIGSSLEAEVHVRVKDPQLAERVNSIDFAEVCIVSSAIVSEFTDDSIGVTRLVDNVKVTDNHKCGRCWRFMPEVKADGELDHRCEDVLNG
jgi:isoleucyl-tRNA synthetase